ncbi:hypothetical protein [Christiangramia crocea]|uniref:Uncharacterized protein n=1 Tax=Christiangramia crocea TaxID=2904124 RepID=A0A9X2A7N0_9FLAO|nr:hypothetical protein [Gramella crocea]MCG9971702.1 hypothetical protein [Gramella crocea]
MSALIAIPMLFGGCSSQSFTSKTMRDAARAPSTFITKSGMDFEENACKSPLVDPADGTEIIMVESIRGVGDYKVPPGKYGMEQNELLRVDCQTGKVLGIVKK